MKEIIIDNKKYFAYSEEELFCNPIVDSNENKVKKNIKYEFPKIIAFREIGGYNLFRLTDKGYLDNAYSHSCYDLDGMLYGDSSLEDNYLEIYQVGVSEELNFSLGDNVKFKSGNIIWEIDNFFLRNDGIILARSKDCNDIEDVTTIEKINPIIFTTEDKIYIYDENQYVYGVCTKANWQTGEFLVSKLKRARNNEYPSYSENNWKFFSSKEIRDEYRNNNIAKFSINEIKDAMLYSKHKNSGEKSSIISEIKFKEKLGIYKF